MPSSGRAAETACERPAHPAKATHPCGYGPMTTPRHRTGPRAYDRCMTSPTVITESEFQVARVAAFGGPLGAAAAFDWLESAMPTLRGQKMYGVLYSGEPDLYFACLRLDGDASDDFGLEQATVPGGPYGRRLVHGWSTKISELPELFDELHADLVTAGHLVDRSRPLIEYYRREDALVIMIPVTPAHNPS